MKSDLEIQKKILCNLYRFDVRQGFWHSKFLQEFKFISMRNLCFKLKKNNNIAFGKTQKSLLLLKVTGLGRQKADLIVAI